MHPVATTGSRGNLMRAITDLRAETFPIGAISQRSGVNIETIRYYERIKMLAQPPRTASGHRMYDRNDLRTLVFIRRSRELGFSLDEIRALLRLSSPDKGSCREVRKIAAHHLQDIRAKTGRLEKDGTFTGEDCGQMLGQDCAGLPCVGHSRYSAVQVVDP
jgi:MerR family mercuric resistance operon transcriptional regulator